jgi:leader peptidase (prepilin peptidase)/N-methyltransferase
MSMDSLYVAYGFVFGLLFGSFLNAVIYRLPLGESVLRPSQCPACDHAIRWYHNLPLVGWLWLRGRCPDCGARISVRYPLVELAGGLLLAAAIARWGITVSAASATVFGYTMIVLALIDVDHRILPNVITIPGAFVGLAFSFFDPRIHWIDSVIGGFLGGGLLYFVAWAYLKARGREGMGMGDVKMMLLVGAFLGWRGALETIFIGSLIGSVVGIVLIRLTRKDWEYALPFGTFLAGAAVIVDFYGPEILDWYLALVGPAS